MDVNGEMLRLARQLKGFQQTEAASRLGIDQSLLSRFENGLVEARSDLAERAANIYGFPVSFFCHNAIRSTALPLAFIRCGVAKPMSQGENSITLWQS